MGKAQKKGKTARREREPVRKWFGMELPAINPERRNILVAASVGSKIFIGLVTAFVFNSFIDAYDLQIYFLAVRNVLMGVWPWANGVIFYYPPLALAPMLIAYAASAVAGGYGFVLTMWALMAACDIVTTLCIYYIGLKLYNERTAFIAAMLCATAFSAAYYSLTRFDAFPTCLAALAMLATVYNNRTKGYLGAVAGLFAKIWPALLYPFMWIYNARDSSIIAEGKERAIWILLAAGLAFGGMLLVGYNKFLGYAEMVYCNTIPYLIFSYLQMAGAAIPFGVIANIFRALTVVAILGALYWMFRHPRSMTTMIKMSLVAIIVLIFFSQYRSPQYVAWLSPFAALLVAGDAWGILAFFGVQTMEYIEFPLTFGTVWVNDHYVSGWAPGLFTALFIAYGLLVWRAMKSEGAGAGSPERKKGG